MIKSAEIVETVVFDETSAQAMAIAETRFNAKSLLADSILLFEKERWGTAIALAILACEEAGKFLIFNHDINALSGNARSLLSHKEKQAAFAYHLKACLRVAGLDEELERSGQADPKERAMTALRMYDEAMANLEKGMPHGNKLLNEIRETTKNDPAYAIAEQATAGLLDKVKQQTLYVDFNGDVVQSPRKFTRADAELYIRAATILIRVIAPPSLVSDKPIPMKQVRVRIKAQI